MTTVKNIPPHKGTYIPSEEEFTLQELDKILSSTIKYDSPTKKILFLGMTLNYTREDQQNFAFNSPSSSGKTFVALEVANYFPTDDIVTLSYTSPTAFFHTQSVLVDENLSPMPQRKDYVDEWIEKWEESNSFPEKGQGRSEWKEKRRDKIRSLKVEWDQTQKYFMVDLEKKIIIFLDQPHDELLKKLRPLLSHDQKFLKVKITDKSREGGHKTKDIIMVGFPTVVFLSVNTSLDGQEKTRNFLLSPEVSQNKLKASILQASNTLANREAFRERVNQDRNRLKLMARVQDIKDADIQQIIINPEDMAYITRKFLDSHKPLEPRHQRDFPRLIAMIKGHALLNLFNRIRNPGIVWANRHDCDEGYNLYDSVSMANERGLPPYIYDFWDKSLKGCLTEEGLSRKEVSALYRGYYHTRIGKNSFKRLIDSLCEAGFVFEDKDPMDKRFIRIYPLGVGGKKSKLSMDGLLAPRYTQES